MPSKIPKQNWSTLARVLIEQHGAIYTAGLLAGILERCTEHNYELQRELSNQLEKSSNKTS